MSLSVKELLETDEFKDFRVLSGAAGLERKIYSVSVMDAPDIYKWLRGGEILITTGYLFKDNLDFMPYLIRKINEANAATLFIKMGRFIDTLPEEVIELSNQLEFPIIHMPINFAFTDVINPVLAKIIWEQTNNIRYSNQIHNTFIELAIEGKNIQDTINKVAELMNKDIVYNDLYHQKYIAKGHAIISKEDINTWMEQCYTYLIRHNNKKYGYIIVVDTNVVMSEYDMIILEHAATIIKLHMQQEISNLQIESRYRDQLVRDIIYKNIKSSEELNNRAKNFGWKFEGSYQAIIVSIDNLKSKYLDENDKQTDFKANEIMEEITYYCKKKLSNPIFTQFSDNVVFIIKDIIQENQGTNIQIFEK